MRFGELLVQVGGALMLLASILPWYEVDLIIETAPLNGWQQPGVVWSVLAVALSLAVALLVMKRSIDPSSLPELTPPLTWSRMIAVAGVLPLACVLLKLANDSDFVAYGFYVAFFAAGMVALGGVLQAAGR
jgi:hypothetical protein